MTIPRRWLSAREAAAQLARALVQKGADWVQEGRVSLGEVAVDRLFPEASPALRALVLGGLALLDERAGVDLQADFRLLVQEELRRRWGRV